MERNGDFGPIFELGAHDMFIFYVPPKIFLAPTVHNINIDDELYKFFQGDRRLAVVQRQQPSASPPKMMFRFPNIEIRFDTLYLVISQFQMLNTTICNQTDVQCNAGRHK